MMSEAKSKELTQKIVICQYFEELLPVLKNEEARRQWSNFNVTAIFSTWVRLWKTAHQAIRDPRTGFALKKDYEAEIKTMRSHLNGEIFLKLVERFMSIRSEISARGLSNIANAISHFPFSQSRIDLLIEIINCANLIPLEEYTAQNLSNLANAAAKIAPNDKDCRALMLYIAKHTNKIPLEEYKANAQNLANLVNAAAKIAPEEKACQALMIHIAKYVNKRSLERYNAQDLTNLANAAAKIAPMDGDCQALMIYIAQHANTCSLEDYKTQELANLANAASKIAPEKKACQALMIHIAEHVNMCSLEDYNAQDLANLANAASKIAPEEPACKTLMIKIAQHINKHLLKEKDYNANAQGLANLASAASKIAPDEKACQTLMIKIAQHINASLLKDYKAQELANLANAASQIVPDKKACQTLMIKIAQHINVSSLKDYKAQELANLSHAVAKMKIQNSDFSKNLATNLMRFDPAKLPIIEVTQIYQFYLYLKSKRLENLFHSNFIEKIQGELNKSPRLPVSTLQKNVTKGVQDFFRPHAAFQVVAEYVAVGARVDIALFEKHPKGSKKVAVIQVDGPAHYKPDSKLVNHKTQFNTELLNYEGWPMVLRIPYFEVYTGNKFNPKALENLLNTKFSNLLKKPVVKKPASSPKFFQFNPNARKFIPGQAYLPSRQEDEKKNSGPKTKSSLSPG